MHPSEEPDWNSSMTSSQNKCPSPMTLWCCPAESSPDRSGPVLTSAKLYTVLWIWPNENWVRKGSLVSQSAGCRQCSPGYTCLFWLQGTLLAHVPPAAHRTPDPLLKSYFPANQFPNYILAKGYSFTGAGLHFLNNLLGLLLAQPCLDPSDRQLCD